MTLAIEKIETIIYNIRGMRVMLDSDLAKLYGVETKTLNQSVRRNIKRFPDDFMFQLTNEEYTFLKSQIVTSKLGSGGKQKPPLVFTENGVAMLSGILKSERSIHVNIAIMRTFVKLRSYLVLDSSNKEEINKLKQETHYLFKVVFERLNEIDTKITPKMPQNRKKIGLK
jgi:hypothetical protein